MNLDYAFVKKRRVHKGQEKCLVKKVDIQGRWLRLKAGAKSNDNDVQLIKGKD